VWDRAFERRRAGKHANGKRVGTSAYRGWTVSAKCQERISQCRCTATQPFNPCDSTYLAKSPVHAKRESSNDRGGDKAVAENASGTKIEGLCHACAKTPRVVDQGFVCPIQNFGMMDNEDIRRCPRSLTFVWLFGALGIARPINPYRIARLLGPTLGTVSSSKL
jgi:hypothetical protein